MIDVPAIFRGLRRMGRPDDPWNDPLPGEEDGAWGIDILVSPEAEDDDGPAPAPPRGEPLAALLRALTALHTPSPVPAPDPAQDDDGGDDGGDDGDDDDDTSSGGGR